MTFTIAIIGRPNVGKSTLFNRLVGKKLALVHDTPGLTRDWREADGFLNDLEFKVIDTAGLEESFDDSIPGRMRQQTERALERADLALLVVDARVGITPMDRHFADWARRQKIKAVLIANKCESKASLAGMYEAFELGLGEPIALSAEHGNGMPELYDLLRPYVDADVAAHTPEETEAESLDKYFEIYQEGAGTGFGDEPAPGEDPNNPIKVAIVGRPNVGKSTLLNALIGEHRSMTGPEAGITRDAVHVDWEFNGRKIRLVDTAGMRRKTRIDNLIEKMSVDDTLRAIRLAQVVVALLGRRVRVRGHDHVAALGAARAGEVVAARGDRVGAGARLGPVGRGRRLAGDGDGGGIGGRRRLRQRCKQGRRAQRGGGKKSVAKHGVASKVGFASRQSTRRQPGRSRGYGRAPILSHGRRARRVTRGRAVRQNRFKHGSTWWRPTRSAPRAHHEAFA